MHIYSVTDPEFKSYGRVWDDVPSSLTAPLVEALSATPIPVFRQVDLSRRGCGGKVGPFPTLQVPGSDGTAPGSCSPDCS